MSCRGVQFQQAPGGEVITVTPQRERVLRGMPYKEYLLTPEWQARRTAALERALYRCQVCNRGRCELHVHHRTYERRGAELPSDLIVLCARHHALFHGKLSPPPEGERVGKPKRRPRGLRPDVSPARCRAPQREIRAYDRGRPGAPGSEAISGYAWAGLTCPRCGSGPRSACTGEFEDWLEVCRERYEAAAGMLRAAWLESYPSWEQLEERARRELGITTDGQDAGRNWRIVTTLVRQWVAERAAGVPSGAC
jgi:hypothetical protein